MTERSAMVWNLPADVRPLAQRLQQGGCTRIWVKAGVDNPGLKHVWEQWAAEDCGFFTQYGIEPVAWFYIYPESPDVQYDTITRALQARPSQDICLNAEIEWDNQEPAFVTAWVHGLRQYLTEHGVVVQRIGFSSVPSWDGGKGSIFHNFPYEAFVQCTDFDMPQDYWLELDEIEYENTRNTDGSPVIPILTACGEMSDASIVKVAQRAIGNCKHLAGFSSWECGNRSYQFDAVAQAYALLPPPDLTTEEIVPVDPDPGTASCYINDKGETVMLLNFGGQATAVEGYTITDAGVTVVNKDDEHYSRSVSSAGGFGQWVKHEEAANQ